MNVIDHIGLQASDYARSRRFYEQALAPLGISVVMQVTKEESGGYEGAGFGRYAPVRFPVSAAVQADRSGATPGGRRSNR